MFRFLTRPYPFETSLMRRTMISIFVGLFIFLFLYIFQPFGLNTYQKGSILMLTLGYGLVTFITLWIFNFIMLFSFPAYFREEKWTTAREIFWFTVIICVIGLVNALYTAQMHIGHLSWRSVFMLESYTLAVAVFPVSISILINQARLSASFERASSEINGVLEKDLHAKTGHAGQASTILQNNAISDAETSVQIVAENGKDRFDVMPSQILFIRSADNYVDVFYHTENQTRCELIRTTLKKCEELFSRFPQFFRCHKSYLVNLNKVNHVSGNAQGYKLHLSGSDELVPVSRTHNGTIRERLATRP